MCGIAGIWNCRPGFDAEAAVGVMLDSMQHRGPDGRGALSFDGGERDVSVDSAPAQFSYARALMGMSQSAAPPGDVHIISSAPISDALEGRAEGQGAEGLEVRDGASVGRMTMTLDPRT